MKIGSSWKNRQLWVFTVILKKVKYFDQFYFIILYLVKEYKKK